MNFSSSSSSSGDMADDLALSLVVIADAELESRQEQGSVEDHHPSSSLLVFTNL